MYSSWLDVGHNRLVGTINPALFSTWNRTLTHFYIHQNEFVGTIPTEIGLLSKVDTFYVSSNRLSGTIPTEVGLMTDATELWFDHIPLSGTIPTEM
jgi:hypothetical protein